MLIENVSTAQGPARSAVMKNTKPAKILVVDDEPQIRRVLRSVLTAQGYLVIEARSGEEALDEIEASPVDLVVLDINMPGMGGLEACRHIRQISKAPVLMLTVRSSETDKVTAFDAGADDYLVKPFGTQELLVRIRALRRRAAVPERIPSFVGGGLEVDFERHRVSVNSHPVHLTPKEFELLELLIVNEGKPVSHQMLIRSLWGEEDWTARERLRVFVNQLRKKIEPANGTSRYVHTEPLIGYRFEIEAARQKRVRTAKT